MDHLKKLDQRLSQIEALANLVISECCNARQQLGLLRTPTTRKGLQDQQISWAVAKRTANRLKKKSK